RTFEGSDARVVGWTPGGEILYTTRHWSGLPANQLLRLDPATGRSVLLPLAQAADGDFTPDGKTLFFTRFAFQGSHTKRYQGGTAQSLWRYREGDAEAIPLSADFAGTSREPMVWQGRLYFVCDRDGTLNLWSMDEDGHDLKQLTAHRGWDVTSPSLSEGRIVYQLGADLRLYDVAAAKDEPLPIRLVSDFDQMREMWVQSPMDYLTAFDLSSSGDRVALTARGEVFVAPVKKGRLVEVTRKPGVRYREARFLPDGKSVLALSDESGEVELWKLPANGVGSPEQLTSDAKVLRWEALPSPDGKWIAHRDKDRQLWLLNVKTRKNNRIAVSAYSDFQDLEWSPDGRWLAWAVAGANTFLRISLYDTASGRTLALTSDRFNSWSPTWSVDGKWLWFLSDRELRTLVQGPWGTRQPDPFLTATTKIFGAALKKGLRSPFQPPDELHPEPAKDDDKEDKAEAEAEARSAGKKQKKGKEAEDDDKSKSSPALKAEKVEIDLDGLAERLVEVPVEAGNYDSLSANEDRLYWLASDPSFEEEPTSSLMALAFSGEKPEAKTVVDEITDYQLSADGKKLAVRKAKALYVFAAGEDSPDDLDSVKVDLAGWTFPIDPKEQWRQMFREAWRLERDYFYDPKMHGVDWPAMLEKYRPLSLRVTSRGELNDLLGQMVSELSALHTFVHGGDRRKGDTDVDVASLGAVLVRDQKGHYRVDRLYGWDPDLPATVPPLAAPGVGIKVGDIIASINGVPVLSVPDVGLLLRNQADHQVLLGVVDGKTGTWRDVVVVPLSPKQADDLRYTDWELSRRKRVEEKGQSHLGYLHLR
ncbi:MAG TPA: PDZ domain-containing protein, partial [Thermoanaerobaculia bacterium]|nr:PDZ domain-containing protein [Thermoanaerobaculia bacterium]